MTDSPHYILHAGYGKTGTTGIQRTLAANRQQLRDAGFLYPDARANGAWLYGRDHNMLGRALAGRSGWWGLAPEDFFDQFEEQRRRANAHTVILSAETFLGGVQPWDFGDTDSYHAAAERTVERLGDLIGARRVTVVVYLRRQDHWLESVINQNIKFGGLVGPQLAGLSVAETISVYAPRLDYAATLSPWATVFGTDALSVGVYESEQLRDGDVVSDFTHRVGLERAGLVDSPRDAASRNPGLARDVLEFKRILNAVPKPKYEERALAEDLRAISEEMQAGEASDATLLDCSTRREILSRYADSNAQVARTYLGRDDGVLFREPWPDTDEGRHYQGLSAERAIEIYLRLERRRRSTGGRMRLLRHWIAERLRRRLPVLHGLARTIRAKIAGAG